MASDPTNAPGVIDRKLFVGGLLPFTTEGSLAAHFQQYGGIEEVKVIYDKHTGRSKGYGFVLFQDQSSAQAAANNPNPTLDGKQCNCNLASLNAKPMEKQTRRPQKRAQPYGMVPGGMEFSQPKRMKIDNNAPAAPKASYVQQLSQNGQPVPTKDAVLEKVRSLKAENRVLEAFSYLVELWELFHPETDAEYDAELKELTQLAREARNKQADDDGIAHDPEPAAPTTEASTASGPNAETKTEASPSNNTENASNSEQSGNTAQDYADAYQDGYHAEEASDAMDQGENHQEENHDFPDLEADSHPDEMQTTENGSAEPQSS